MTTSACMVTAVSGFIEQVGSMIKEFLNTIVIHQHNTIKLQRASTDTCQQSNIYMLIAIIRTACIYNCHAHCKKTNRLF